VLVKLWRRLASSFWFDLARTRFFNCGLWSAGDRFWVSPRGRIDQGRQLAKREQAKGCGAIRRRAQRRGRNAIVAAGIFRVAGVVGFAGHRMSDRGHSRLGRSTPLLAYGVRSCPACARPANVCDPDSRCRQAAKISRSDRLGGRFVVARYVRLASANCSSAV
jgi:hypothetical protein